MAQRKRAADESLDLPAQRKQRLQEVDGNTLRQTKDAAPPAASAKSTATAVKESSSVADVWRIDLKERQSIDMEYDGIKDLLPTVARKAFQLARNFKTADLEKWQSLAFAPFQATEDQIAETLNLHRQAIDKVDAEIQVHNRDVANAAEKIEYWAGRTINPNGYHLSRPALLYCFPPDRVRGNPNSAQFMWDQDVWTIQQTMGKKIDKESIPKMFFADAIPLKLDSATHPRHLSTPAFKLNNAVPQVEAYLSHFLSPAMMARATSPGYTILIGAPNRNFMQAFAREIKVANADLDYKYIKDMIIGQTPKFTYRKWGGEDITIPVLMTFRRNEPVHICFFIYHNSFHKFPHANSLNNFLQTFAQDLVHNALSHLLHADDPAFKIGKKSANSFVNLLRFPPAQFEKIPQQTRLDDFANGRPLPHNKGETSGSPISQERPALISDEVGDDDSYSDNDDDLDVTERLADGAASTPDLLSPQLFDKENVDLPVMILPAEYNGPVAMFTLLGRLIWEAPHLCTIFAHLPKPLQDVAEQAHTAGVKMDDWYDLEEFLKSQSLSKVVDKDVNFYNKFWTKVAYMKSEEIPSDEAMKKKGQSEVIVKAVRCAASGTRGVTYDVLICFIQSHWPSWWKQHSSTFPKSFSQVSLSKIQNMPFLHRYYVKA